jgi:hypothetical protein
MPEAITGIEIISTKPMMHMDTCVMIPTAWLCPMNIKYTAVSEFLGFHLSEVLFSSTKTSAIPGNTSKSG